MRILVGPEAWEHCNFETLNEDDTVTFSRDGQQLKWHISDILSVATDFPFVT